MGGRFRWLFGLFVIALLAMIGAYAYDLGVAHGLAEGARLTTPGGAPVVFWPRPWHLGFFPFGPLFFIFFWLVLVRGLFWRGGWPGRRYGHGGGVPPAFEEWHRQAHAREGQPPPPADAKV